MSYLPYDQSDQDGLSVLLFQFTQGSTTFYYNSSAQDIEWNSITWSQISIECSEFSQTNELQKNVISIKLPSTAALAQTFNTFYPERVTSLTIYHGHLTDPDQQYIAVWKGKVTAAEPDGRQLLIDAEPIFTSIKRPGLRASFTRLCRHLLYEPGCNVDKLLFQVSAQVTAIAGLTITVPAADSSVYPAGYFIAGFIELSTGEQCYIVNHVGDQLTLIRSFKALSDAFALSSPLSVFIYPGCDLSETTCNNLFDNLDNQGGFSRIPTDSPFNGSSIV